MQTVKSRFVSLCVQIDSLHFTKIGIGIKQRLGFIVSFLEDALEHFTHLDCIRNDPWWSQLPPQ